MSFATKAALSSSDHRIIVEVDIGLNNEQWVNNGAGIWAVNPNNTYPWVGPPNDDMVARYALDGDSLDSTGNGNDGTDTDITYEAGFAGKAASFNGSSSKIAIPSGLPAGDISLSLWFELPANPPAALGVLFHQPGGINPRQLYIQNTTGRIIWGSRDSGGVNERISVVPSGDWSAGEWNHLVAVQDGLTTLVYIDGVLIDSDTHASIYTAFLATGTIGAQPTAWWSLGLIDEVRIYDRALSAAEVAELFTRDYDAEFFLTGFTAQGFRPIGSVKVDGASLQLGTSTADLADTPRAWYFDGATLTLYVTMPNFDEPALHTVAIGQVFAFARGSFVPIDGPVPVEGRLVNTPSVSASRDPLFFGRLRFNGSSVVLQNGDGEFNTWGRDVDIYGNDCRILIGFEDLPYSEYLRVFTGFMQPLTVNEDTISIGIIDKRKQLSRPITYVTTNTNALTAIEEIISETQGFTFDSTFYDLTAWETARALVANVTINMQEPDDAINVIELIVSSVFGLFRTDADGLYTFKVVNGDDSIETLIQASDISNTHSIAYDPTAVVSSVRVGFNRDWVTTGDQYTFFTDDTREQSVFNVYKTYNEREFLTVLIDEAAATTFATTILDYNDTVRGVETIIVPLENSNIVLGDQVGVVTQRGAQPMLGERKAEVVSVSYALDVPQMQLGIRLGGTVESILTNEAGAILTTEGNAILMVG